MHRNIEQAALTVREIDYSIKIRDKDKSRSEIRDVLRAELTRFDENLRRKRMDSENPISEFLRINIERSILIRENTRIYFLNYREKEGSLHIDFTVLVISGYINFGPIRQALDYLVKDTIAGYFEEILERHFPVSITVETNDKEVYTVTDPVLQLRSPDQPKRDTLSRTLAIIAISCVLAMTLFMGIRAISRNWIKENESLKDKYMELLIEKKIDDAVTKQKFNIILTAPADTLRTSSPQIQPNGRR